MNQKVTFATSTFVAEHGGRAVHVRAGDPWDADDPFVKANPDSFGDHPQLRRTTPPPPAAGPVETPTKVERATRAPGEKRSGGR